MSETKKTCQVQMHDGKPCGRDLYDEEFCIFHSKREDKDLNLFHGELYQILRDNSLKAYDFTGFIIPINAIFLKKFSKFTNFKNAVFKGNADFEDAVFGGGGIFNNVCFDKEANFNGALFSSYVDFTDTHFKGKSNFRLCIFNNEVSFKKGVFQSEVDFWNASFAKGASFIETIFNKETSFRLVNFGKMVYIEQTIFKGQVNFKFAKFVGGAIFDRSIFEADSTFEFSSFDQRLLIKTQESDKIAFKGETDFRSVKFLKPEDAQFHKIDLSRVRFLETDVHRVHFIDVNWNKENGKGRNRVFDEVSSNPDNNKYDYALIAQLYRQLRANYEENLQYSEAGDFYIGEMEMRRKAETSVFRKLPLILYKAISNYGESYYRPLCWILAILLLFPIFFIIAGIQPVNHEHIIMATEKITNYSTSFWYSTSIFSFIRDKKCTTTNNWGDALFVTESILSPIMLAFLLLALRRRFKR